LKLFLEEFQPYVSYVITISQRYGQTDGQTTLRSNRRNRF